jgi:hypothetical protein
MADIAKVLIVVGIALMISGLSIHFSGKLSGLGRLPGAFSSIIKSTSREKARRAASSDFKGKLRGDILIKKENVTVYIPITTSLLISVILSLLLFLWNHT